MFHRSTACPTDVTVTPSADASVYIHVYWPRTLCALCDFWVMRARAFYLQCRHAFFDPKKIKELVVSYDARDSSRAAFQKKPRTLKAASSKRRTYGLVLCMHWFHYSVLFIVEHNQVVLVHMETLGSIRTSYMYVCMVTHIARVWINRVRLPILHVVS